ncbi:hypothetical protein LXL04_005241 [Taraxacum kok-saghyz]
MSSGSSSFSSRRPDQLDYQHPCLCKIPSHVKTAKTPDNYGRKFRVCVNTLSSRSPQCKFWQWLDDGSVDPSRISSEICEVEPTASVGLKMATMENEISNCKMKMLKENMAFKHELEKIRLELIYCKAVMFVIISMYVINLVLKVECNFRVKCFLKCKFEILWKVIKPLQKMCPCVSQKAYALNNKIP